MMHVIGSLGVALLGLGFSWNGTLTHIASPLAGTDKAVILYSREKQDLGSKVSTYMLTIHESYHVDDSDVLPFKNQDSFSYSSCPPTLLISSSPEIQEDRIRQLHSALLLKRMLPLPVYSGLPAHRHGTSRSARRMSSSQT